MVRYGPNVGFSQSSFGGHAAWFVNKHDQRSSDVVFWYRWSKPGTDFIVRLVFKNKSYKYGIWMAPEASVFVMSVGKRHPHVLTESSPCPETSVTSWQAAMAVRSHLQQTLIKHELLKRVITPFWSLCYDQSDHLISLISVIQRQVRVWVSLLHSSHDEGFSEPLNHSHSNWTGVVSRDSSSFSHRQEHMVPQ